MISNICLSCGDDLDWPSGDGCANMTAHKNESVVLSNQEVELYEVLKEHWFHHHIYKERAVRAISDLLKGNKPWEMLVTDVVDNEDGGTTISFDLDKEAHQAMANIGVQFVLHCAAAEVDMQVALDAILKMGESHE